MLFQKGRDRIHTPEGKSGGLRVSFVNGERVASHPKERTFRQLDLRDTDSRFKQQIILILTVLFVLLLSPIRVYLSMLPPRTRTRTRTLTRTRSSVILIPVTMLPFPFSIRTTLGFSSESPAPLSSFESTALGGELMETSLP